jgi:hypothetical protein
LRTLGGASVEGVLVKSKEGRNTKVEHKWNGEAVRSKSSNVSNLTGISAERLDSFFGTGKGVLIGCSMGVCSTRVPVELGAEFRSEKRAEWNAGIGTPKF